VTLVSAPAHRIVNSVGGQVWLFFYLKTLCSIYGLDWSSQCRANYIICTWI